MQICQPAHTVSPEIMKALKGLLIRKIAITFTFWCVPLLLFPSSWFLALGIPVPGSMIFMRLLGAAYLALLVGYFMGLKGISAGESPKPVLTMGIASNGSAALLLTSSGATGGWSSWGGGAQAFLWISAVGALWITFSLLMFRRRLCGMTS